MAKYVYILMVSTNLLSSAHAMRKTYQPTDDPSKTNAVKKSSTNEKKSEHSSGSDSDEKSILQSHHLNLENIVLQQQNIIEQFTALQLQWAQFSKSIEVVRELKKKKLQERMTAKKRDRIIQAGNEAIHNEKLKWKIEKINNYRLHKEKVDHEIRRATDEERTRFFLNGIKQYEPVEIFTDNEWLSIGEFRKKRNYTFDEKQKTLKEKLFEGVRKKAELEETRKVYKELTQEIDLI